MTRVETEALASMRSLPSLTAWDRHDFYIAQRDGRPISFHVLRLPDGKHGRWDVMNNTVGWVGSISPQAIQKKISTKANGLPRYRSALMSAYLLVVADGSVSSGFLELGRSGVLDPSGFDAVYFQRYPSEGTQLVTQARQAR